MTVADSILADLRQARGWYCGAAWYASFRPTFSQRIGELRRKGFAIESRVCRRDGHDHHGTIHEYRLVSKPEQLRMIG